MTPRKLKYARAASCDGVFASRDFAPNAFPMRMSMAAFCVRIEGLKRVAEVRDQGSARRIAATELAKPSVFAVANAAA